MPVGLQTLDGRLVRCSIYFPFELPPIFLPAVPFFAARFAAFASVAAADSVVAANSGLAAPQAIAGVAQADTSSVPLSIVGDVGFNVLSALGARGRAWCLKEMDPSRIIAGFVEMYEQAAAGRWP